MLCPLESQEHEHRYRQQIAGILLDGRPIGHTAVSHRQSGAGSWKNRLTQHLAGEFEEDTEQGQGCEQGEEPEDPLGIAKGDIEHPLDGEKTRGCDLLVAQRGGDQVQQTTIGNIAG